MIALQRQLEKELLAWRNQTGNSSHEEHTLSEITDFKGDET